MMVDSHGICNSEFQQQAFIRNFSPKSGGRYQITAFRLLCHRLSHWVNNGGLSVSRCYSSQVYRCLISIQLATFVCKRAITKQQTNEFPILLFYVAEGRFNFFCLSIITGYDGHSTNDGFCIFGVVVIGTLFRCFHYRDAVIDSLCDSSIYSSN